jgi:hypothetical protein
MDMQKLAERSYKIAEFAVRNKFVPASEQYDFAHECFLKLVDNEEYGSVIKWASVDYLRKFNGRSDLALSWRQKTISTDLDIFISNFCFEHVDAQIDAHQIKCMVFEMLSDSEREFIELVFFSDFLQKDIARIYDITEAAVSLRIKYICEKLKRVFDEVDITKDCI